MISPRVVCAAALLAAALLAVPTAAQAKTQLKTQALAQARPQAAAPPQLTLPAPTGPCPLGTVSLHLVDRSRKDPFAGAGHDRELMISLTYPARKVAAYPVAPWLPPKAAAQYLRQEGLPPGAVLLPQTHGHEGAPADRREGRLPVVLYSPGNDSFRSANTVVVEELASRGYVVATIDHTYDGLVEFPDGRVVPPAPDGGKTGRVIYEQRIADTRFVLDQLAVVNRGGNPDAEHRKLPKGLRGLLDLDRVGMFGYSAGGPTVASAMVEDRRIKAGLAMDGPVAGPVVTAGLDRPYMLMTATKAVRDRIPDLATFWSNLKGWKLNIRTEGVEHVSYGDLEMIAPQVASLLKWTPAQLAEQIGTLAPERGEAVQRAYPLAFFERNLRGRGHLLDGPSPRFPEVTFIP
ncbi:alpha/beta hydrolase family protein [Nonomuraea angiospora]|uniref:Dienelactone hydrolase n=1 Tax=Nonomuraea angiospora TaxID=46172 RepID=A0ABR9LPW5_9ACTN|nr:lipase [Nonomuraea angiospora]MBE1582694.1 putative dienelactone hydrolase [Nonomuraea angiospora]